MQAESRGTDGYLDAFSAQLGLLGEAGQERLRHARVHVSGTGGVGSSLLAALAAAGVGRLTFNDPQTLEIDNLNRFPYAGPGDVGASKADLIAASFARRPYLKTEALAARTEDEAVSPFYSAANLVACCSNTTSSRLAAAEKAIRFGKPLVDVAVADGRRGLAGFIRLWLPRNAAWSACPGCYLNPAAPSPRGEALFFPVIGVTAGVAAQIAVQLVSGVRYSPLDANNFFVIDLGAYRLEAFSVKRREDCALCKAAAEVEASC
jgi:molybdopterin/thiamine biosynthesis adenylyltransferase